MDTVEICCLSNGHFAVVRVVMLISKTSSVFYLWQVYVIWWPVLSPCVDSRKCCFQNYWSIHCFLPLSNNLIGYDQRPIQNVWCSYIYPWINTIMLCYVWISWSSCPYALCDVTKFEERPVMPHATSTFTAHCMNITFSTCNGAGNTPSASHLIHAGWAKPFYCSCITLTRG